MPRIIPNENTFVQFCTTIANIAAPTKAELAAGVNLTPFVITVNATTRGNVVQTPAFDSRFETSIPGTVTSTFEVDMYRDDTTDTAWNTLPRNTKGYFVVTRFGGKGGPSSTPAQPLYSPTSGDKVEVWPVVVTTRSATNLTSNSAQTFQVQCSVFALPNEASVVV